MPSSCRWKMGTCSGARRSSCCARRAGMPTIARSSQCTANTRAREAGAASTFPNWSSKPAKISSSFAGRRASSNQRRRLEDGSAALVAHQAVQDAAERKRKGIPAVVIGGTERRADDGAAVQAVLQGVPGEPFVVGTEDTVGGAGENRAPPQPAARHGQREDSGVVAADALGHPELLAAPHRALNERADADEEAVARRFLVAAVVMGEGESHPPRAGDLLDHGRPFTPTVGAAPDGDGALRCVGAERLARTRRPLAVTA